MNTVTVSQPFCYAIKDGANIKLYVLVKAPANKIVEFPSDRVLPQIGQIIKFKILIKDLPAGSTYIEDNYKNYVFAASGLDMIQVQTWNVIPGTPPTEIKTMKIEFDDLNEVGVDGVTLPEIEDERSDAVLDTPYVCTKRSADGHSFTAEVYVRTGTEQNFKVNYSGPTTDANKDTQTSIENTGADNKGTDFTTELKKFDVQNVNGTLGAHTASYTDKGKGKSKKGKTKNKHHTEFPFPMPKPQ